MIKNPEKRIGRIKEEFLVRQTLTYLKMTTNEIVKKEIKSCQKKAMSEWNKISSPLLNKFYSQNENEVVEEEVTIEDFGEITL